MKVTEILKKEHEIILAKIEHALATFATDEWKDVYYWEDFLNFLRTFADDYHHAKEEKIYFEWMREKEPSMQEGPLHCMLIEHDESRRVVQNAEKILASIRNDGSNDWDRFKTFVIEYAEIIRRHIDKENNILYNMAEGLDQVAGDGDQKMYPLFEEVEKKYGETIGEFL